MITEKLKFFIKNRLNEIQNNEWDKIYQYLAYRCDASLIGEFTFYMVDSGINPLLHMDRIPHSYLFNGCLPELHLQIPENIGYIGEFAFYNTLLGSLTIPRSVRYIGEGALPTHTPIIIPYNSIEEFKEHVKFRLEEWKDYIFISSITGKQLGGRVSLW